MFWCDNTAPVACRTLHNKADWKEGRLVLSDERYEDGKKHLFQELFAFDTPDSFTQTLAEGEAGGQPQTISHNSGDQKEALMEMAFAAQILPEFRADRRQSGNY